MKKIISVSLLFLMLTSSLIALELQKSQNYNFQNINGWVLSEKLDGIRAYWDGKKLYTRKGIEIFAPVNFIKNFPQFHLDGELWTKRDDFENIQSIVMDKEPSSKWNEITYNIFEAPNIEGNFFQRMQKVENWFNKYENHKVKIISQNKIIDIKQLKKLYNKIIAKGGEGIMVKDPTLSYEELLEKKSLLKYKEFEDTEGVVIGHNFNENGKFKSLIVELQNKTKFNLGGGFIKEERQNYPKIGDVVRFKYYGFTKYGKPKFASFLNVRKD